MFVHAKKITKAKKKKKSTDANLRKQQKEQYVHKLIPVCLCTKYYTKGTVYSRVETKAVTSGQGVDKNWA